MNRVQFILRVQFISCTIAIGAGCGQRPAAKIEVPDRSKNTTQSGDSVKSEPDGSHDRTKATASTLKVIPISERPGLHNVLQLTDRLYSGAQPEGEEGFESLVSLGVTTIVSVDGARPNLDAARKYGMRYVHIPIGYDGVGERAGLSLARLMLDLDGPIYLHCHHGNHRGPAAAAIACIAGGAADGESALEILDKAGTSKDYPGLWRDVAAYVPPLPGDDLPELVELAEVKSLAVAMANMDRSFDLLKLCRDSEWSVPPKHPDIVPAQEALQLEEALREIRRNLVTDRDERFKKWLADAEQYATSLEDALKIGDHQRATTQFQSLDKACKQCHGQYRN